jgi:hypothetical protein
MNEELRIKNKEQSQVKAGGKIERAKRGNGETVRKAEGGREKK